MSKYDYIKEIIKENTAKGKEHLSNFANKIKSSDDDLYPSVSIPTELLPEEDNSELYKKLALALVIGSGEGALMSHLLQGDDEENLENEYLMEIMENSN
jgi:hypothetical protein